MRELTTVPALTLCPAAFTHDDTFSGLQIPLRCPLPYRRISPFDLFPFGDVLYVLTSTIYSTELQTKRKTTETPQTARHRLSATVSHLPWVKFAASSVLRAANTYLLMWDKLFIDTSAITATLDRLRSGSCIWHLEFMLYHVLTNNHKHRGHSLLLDRQL